MTDARVLRLLARPGLSSDRPIYEPIAPAEPTRRPEAKVGANLSLRRVGVGAAPQGTLTPAPIPSPYAVGAEPRTPVHPGPSVSRRPAGPAALCAREPNSHAH